MKKGFTLIELLIVIIIVALLVAVSVPKYKTAMEKARAQEGITNLNAVADLANAYYFSHNGTYTGFNPTADQLDTTKETYFTIEYIASGDNLVISASRKNGKYGLTLNFSGGSVISRNCVASNDNQVLCDAIGWGN